ncbi:DUF4160 domain-containing protein [Argonema galeatum]|uniref:DUF4160 domain-containing protein n=1 Tax=Argonema galeatum TaxID=2942762 RepID=UPI00201310E2|nr:DUF4160 domain-containing protein [Argonema galeatum]MCL1464388.1 DUF4160 domain-containing protein [Argonema galeatum A003/A1]
MPTVLKKDGFSVRIYTNDHLPSHVHVFKAQGEVKINLGSETERPSLIQVLNMSNKDATKALNLVIAHQLELLTKWREIHGEPTTE